MDTSVGLVGVGGVGDCGGSGYIASFSLRVATPESFLSIISAVIVVANEVWRNKYYHSAKDMISCVKARVNTAQ